MIGRGISTWLVLSFAAVGGALIHSGCSSPSTDQDQDTRPFKALGLIYGKYVGSHRGRQPANQAELLKFATAKESSLLSQLGVSDPEEMFNSPRDGKPLDVVYGTSTVSDPNPIAAYEQQPMNDKRWVVWTTGALMEVDEAEFQTIKPQP
jgi:hypothetical protein